MLILVLYLAAISLCLWAYLKYDPEIVVNDWYDLTRADLVSSIHLTRVTIDVQINMLRDRHAGSEPTQGALFTSALREARLIARLGPLIARMRISAGAGGTTWREAYVRLFQVKRAMDQAVRKKDPLSALETASAVVTDTLESLTLLNGGISRCAAVSQSDQELDECS